MADFDHLLANLILANHILHHHAVVDAFGHISIRHPTNTAVFIMSANMAPALVRQPADFVEYNVFDAQSAHGSQTKGFVERYIHSELYKRYPGVMCVVHAHADDVLPFTVSGVPMRAMYHMAGFLGHGPVHTFDVEEHYQKGDVHDLLISNTRLGGALAECFDEKGREGEDVPERALVMMRRHGFTTWGRGIKEAVYRSVYATNNAKLQSQATMLRGAVDGLAGEQTEQGSLSLAEYSFEGLTEEQAGDAEAANLRAVERPWGLWVQEVKCQALYTSSVYKG